jgi:hypothetical protein
MELLFSLIESVWADSNPARLTESVMLLGIIWWKLKPHLKKIEDELAKLNANMRDGFQAGEVRFAKVEGRIDRLETQGEQ